MTLSVCICTRDRPAPLQRALASLWRVAIPGAEWEVLIIDNSAAGGPAGLEGRLPRGAAPLRVVAEPRAGLSHARNRAVEASEAEYLIFIDDDATVPPGWLAAYVAGFERHPRAAFWGGPIIARLEGDSSHLRRAGQAFSALQQVMPGALGHLEPDLPEGPLPPDGQVLPWGANMAFRRRALDGCWFDPARGRRPADPFGAGEETHLFQQLMRVGGSGVWLPEARLDHHIGPERCTRRYLKSFSWGIGVMEGRRSAEVGTDAEAAWRWASEALKDRRRRKWRTLPWAPLEDRLRVLKDLAFMEGYIHGFQRALQEKDGRVRR